MFSVMQSFMAVKSSQSYFNDLYSFDTEKCLQAAKCLKNYVIGSNRKKGEIIESGIVPRLIQLLSDVSTPVEIKINAIAILGSLAKGTDNHIKALVDMGVVPHLINGLFSEDTKLTEYCLRCLLTVFQSSHAPVELLYENENVKFRLINLAEAYQVSAETGKAVKSHFDDLYSADTEKCLHAIVWMKNYVIGSNRKKGDIIAQGIVPRLIKLLSDVSTPVQIKINATVTLGSLAKGTDDHIKALVDMGVVPHLLNGMNQIFVISSLDKLFSEDIKLTEYCLCCLRTVFQSSHAPAELLYENTDLINRLFVVSMHSVQNQVSVTTILAATCKTTERQNLLHKEGVLKMIAALLKSPLHNVQMSALNCLANLTYQNSDVCFWLQCTSYLGIPFPQLAASLTGRSHSVDVQLAAAKALANIHRANNVSTHPKILEGALSCLVRMCKDDKPAEQRIEATNILVFMTESDIPLQRCVSVHLFPSLLSLLGGPPDTDDLKLLIERKQAAFRTFASLGAKDQFLRKEIIELDDFMKHVVTALEEPIPDVKLAAVKCLHTLSKSVRNLYFAFQKHGVWQTLMQVLKVDDEVLKIAASALCKALIDYPPSKNPIVESGGVDILGVLAKNENPSIRLNAVWALKTLAFSADNQRRSQIVESLGVDYLFSLLEDSENVVAEKSRVLLKNLRLCKCRNRVIMY